MKDEPNIIKRKTPPYWWPDVSAMLQLLLSGAIVVMVGFILYQLLGGAMDIKQDQRDLLMTLFGFILGCFKDVYGYTFGSSAGQKRQGEVITQSLENKDKVIADGVVKAAELAANVNGVSADALKAAAIVAPAAATVAAPPAAHDAAPAAAREAVADALAENGIPTKPKE